MTQIIRLPLRTFLKMAVFLIALCLASPARSSPPWGSYPHRPANLVDLVPPDGRRFSLVHDFDYIDPSQRRWNAPAGLITDGASIPIPFWDVIGGPYEGLYREAALVHDAACCAQTTPWQDVHYMFYNAMRCSGVSWSKAKLMFYAVWYQGPRWTRLNTSMPEECKLKSPVRASVQRKLVQVIQNRTLSPAETRTVARPFFTDRPMSDVAATKFVARLKRRPVTSEEAAVISLSVGQSQLSSDIDLKQLEKWIKKENPSVETLKTRAEETRKQKQAETTKAFGPASRQQLFPELPELRRQTAK